MGTTSLTASSKSESKSYTCINHRLSMSKDSLELSLNASYENGRADAERFNFGKIYQGCFSIAFTFLLTHFTCETYKSIGVINSDIISVIVIVLFVAFLILGIASICYSKTRVKSMTDQRKIAVTHVFKSINFSIDKQDDASQQ